MAFGTALSIAFTAMLTTAVPDAQDVLARVEAAYSGKTYRDRAVERHSFNEAVIRTEVVFDPVRGVRFTEVTPPWDAGTHSRTMIYWGTPDCARVYWADIRYTEQKCGRLCSSASRRPALRLFCRFVLRDRSRIAKLVVVDPHVEPRLLDGTPAYVVTLSDSGRPAELWVDPQSYKIRRFADLEKGWELTVDFERVELGGPIADEELTFEPPFTRQQFVRDHPKIWVMLLFAGAFLAGAVLWAIALFRADVERRSRVMLRTLKVLLIISVVGYALVVVLGFALLPADGHPPGIVGVVIAAGFWTSIVMLMGAALGGALVVEALVRRRRTA